MSGNLHIANSMMERPKRDSHSAVASSRLLLVSYAFPPLAVPMAPYVAKTMAACKEHGYSVDVVAADTFHPDIARDESLSSYVRSHFASIVRLRPKQLSAYARLGLRRWLVEPDAMHVLHRTALCFLEQLPLDQYAAIITFSPFHSVNPVLCQLKRRYPQIRWIAEFGDPWARNPIESSRKRQNWNSLHEAETVMTADRLLFSSLAARDLMVGNTSSKVQQKAAILPHCWDPSLYGGRQPIRDGKLRIRHVGTLFGRRSPEPIFHAIRALLQRRPELQGRLALELIGTVPAAMLQTEAARALPSGLVQSREPVEYVHSLALMEEADILLLIEPLVRLNLFIPSKLTDYIGAGRPVVALAPPGPSRDLLEEVNAWHAAPDDIPAIAWALESAIDYVDAGEPTKWYRPAVRERLRSTSVARLLLDAVEVVGG